MVLLIAASPSRAEESYPLHPDSQTQPGVPEDRVESYRFTSSCVFARPDAKTLCVSCGTRVFRRKTQIEGLAPWQDSVVPEKPRL
ncbi:hypothetical protein RMSM_00436 [Rhodopirellula maiorica SM1]|uniref:Uncharacterized protein n=1 Tax=Rhodopirellula maiorica SM1 TaxID=1265738 RepID=M5S906_9BACT|nr:hypothetical protein [Rhodopirellula maiorica]EMI22654.1 hypothetical protein RMSM_00436 [Rhodopirellula maiorica SM1]